MTHPQTPARMSVQFTDEESRVAHDIAERWAVLCVQQGHEPAPDPMRGVLQFALWCLQGMAASHATEELEAQREAGHLEH